jgi:YegS/Rv2252/BmrU family lipid kinase
LDHADAWSPRHIVAIVNPATRRPADPIVALLRERVPPGVSLDVRLTERAGATAELTRAALPGADLVVAVGGDGTVAAVATAIAGARADGAPEVPLAIVPAGSTNITARELRIPINPAAAVDLIYGRRPQTLAPIDLGVCESERFLHMAGAGLDSRFFAETDPALKRRFGWLAYLPPAARNLRIEPARFRIVADDTTLEVDSPLVNVANGGALVVAGFQLYPDIRTDDGWLDVLIFTPRGLPAILRTLARTASRSLDRSPFVTRLRARRVELSADPPLPIQLDGDVVLQTPATFSLEPSALRVVVPAVR